MVKKEKVEKIVTSKDKDIKLCILTSKFYDRSLAYFMFLFELAKEDFPQLEFKDVECQTYGGRNRKGMCGIEFSVTKKTMPDSYKETSDEIINTHYPTV
jgi:hypothetical protein